MLLKYDPFNKLNLARNIAREIMRCPPIPLDSLSRKNSFSGAGIYMLYYVGDFPLYKPLQLLNMDEQFKMPIYVGKADPKGTRKGTGLDPDTNDNPVIARLRNHRDRIKKTNNLKVEHFFFRCVIMDHVWIRLGESGLIDFFQPIWNVHLDGFGNKIPGKKRQHQTSSKWDTIHPGEGWTELLGTAIKMEEEILQDLDMAFHIMVDPDLGLSQIPLDSVWNTEKKSRRQSKGNESCLIK